jgi:hypothetical protein
VDLLYLCPVEEVEDGATEKGGEGGERGGERGREREGDGIALSCVDRTVVSRSP